LTKINAFLTVGHTLDPAYTGTGTGTIDSLIGTGASVLEVITVTLTSSSAYSVAGSVSGALGTGTVGVPFASAVCTFTLSAGGVAWAAADTVTFTMTPPWVALRFNAGVSADDLATHCIWRAPGNDAASQVYVGLFRFSDVTGDYDNLRLLGSTGYDPAQKWSAQPGAVPAGGPVMPGLRTGSMPFWLVANGRRFVAVVKCSTAYESMYAGLIVPYPNPAQYPYPLAIGGTMAWHGSDPASNSTNWRWSYQGWEHGAFCKGGDQPYLTLDSSCQLRLRLIDGTWRGFGAIAAMPALISPSWTMGTDLRAGLDGSYPLFPYLLCDANNSYGELDGVAWVSGFGNVVENTVAQNRIPWLVVQNAFRNTKVDFFVLKLA